MEPLRVPVVDRWVVGLLNQRRVAAEDFVTTEDEGVRLTKQAFPRVLGDWERQLDDTRSGTIVMDRVWAFAHGLRKRGGNPLRIKRQLWMVGIDELP
jgi:hypothetical protein